MKENKNQNLKRRIRAFLYLPYLVASMSLVLSCSNINKNQKNDDPIKNEMLMLPDSLIVYGSFTKKHTDTGLVLPSSFKIYSFIDASCPSCLTDIKNWNKIALEFDRNDVQIILICQSQDNYELLKYLFEKNSLPELSFPLYFDVNNQFFVRNKFLSPAPNHHTVLTDKNNNILVFGDLISEKQHIKQRYIDVMESYKNN